MAVDAVALALAAAISLAGLTWRVALPSAALVMAGGLVAIRWQGLYRSLVSQVRVLEVAGLTRVGAAVAAVLAFEHALAHVAIGLVRIGVALVVTFTLLAVGRGAYRSWLTSARARGRHCRDVIVVGADAEARRIVRLTQLHPDQGTRVVGIVGARGAELGAPWLGDVRDLDAILGVQTGVTGAVVSAAAWQPVQLNEILRELQRHDLHVFVATGIAGIDSRRVRPAPLCHEPLLFVSPPVLGRGQAVAKRVLDVVAAGAALVLVAPLLAIAAAAVRLGDGGPALFRQRRVGRDGREFDVLKLRTMAVDAEERLVDLASSNERHGPLFKMADDPRVTRVGRFLRETSLDELPQLWNVLRGDMSLVGPRPALPVEVEHFTSAARRRELVPPGITGLWQVEARHNPAFEVYERLDLFYVENWSITLDVLILLATAEHVMCGLVVALTRRCRRRSRRDLVHAGPG